MSLRYNDSGSLAANQRCMGKDEVNENEWKAQQLITLMMHHVSTETGTILTSPLNLGDRGCYRIISDVSQFALRNWTILHFLSHSLPSGIFQLYGNCT